MNYWNIKFLLVSASIDNTQDLWLFGARFTAADISLIVLLNRLVMLGIDSRYFSAERRPYLMKYHEQQLKRPSVEQLMKEIRSIMKGMYWQSVLPSSTLGRWATIGLGIGLGYLLYRRINWINPCRLLIRITLLFFKKIISCCSFVFIIGKCWSSLGI